MNLYELTSEYLALLDMMEDETADVNELSEMMVGISDQIEVKADNYGKIIRNLESDLSAIKAEQTRLLSRKKTIENNIEKLKENLKFSMQSLGMNKFKTELFSFTIQKNGGKAPVIMDVTDTSKLPDELVRIIEEPNIDAIRELLDRDGSSIYAHYGERGESLRIR